MAKHVKLIVPICILGSTLGCSDSSTPTVKGTPYTSEAVISGLGSIYLDGVRFTTENAMVLYDDSSSMEATDLQPGMHVALEGLLTADGTLGTASKIYYTEQLCGTIDSVDTLQQTIEILGQSVQFNDNTIFYGIDENNLDLELTPTTYVSVSGFMNDQGQLIASRVAKKDDMSISYRLQGKITNHDANTKTFNLGALSVDYSGSTLHDIGADDIANELIVMVKGPANALNKTNMTFAPEVLKLDASSATREFPENSHRGVEGLIKNIVSSADFHVRGIHVNTNADTVYRHGNAQNIQTSARVKIKGTFDANNTLIAEMIVFHKNNDLKVKGVVEAVDYTEKTISVSGVTYRFSEHTYTEDDSKRNKRGLLEKSTGFAIGDYVELEGFMDANNVFIAGKIKLEDKPTDFDTKKQLMLRGEASNVVTNGLTLQGKAIVYDANTKFFNDIKVEIQQSDFNTLLVSNKHVYVYAEMVNENLVAKMMGIKGQKLFANKRPLRMVGLYESTAGTSSTMTFSINNRVVHPEFEALKMRTITGAHVITDYTSLENFANAMDAAKLDNSLVEVQGYFNENDSKYYAHELTFFESPDLMRKPYKARPGGRHERDPNKTPKKDPRFGDGYLK